MGKIVDTEIKYRPQSLADYVYPNAEVKEVATAYGTGDITRPLILSGVNGTGKSLLARLIPHAIESVTPQINFVRASDLNSNKEVFAHFTRNKQFDKFFTVNNQQYGYHVIEEVNFEAKASDALRVVLDDFRGLDLTIMTTNELAKIDIGVRSRCETLNVPPCEPLVFLPYAKHIINSEGYDIEDGILFDALDAVYQVKPDNRRYYQALDELIRKA